MKSLTTFKRGVAMGQDFFTWRKSVLDGSIDRRDISIILLDEKRTERVRYNLTAAWPDLAHMLEWWRQRQQSAQEPPEKLERVTYHVSPTWIEAVRREADLTGESYAAVVNRAFAAYFGAKST